MDKNLSKPDALVGRMESLADSTRLRLLSLLDRHELGVVELCEVLQLPQSTVSRHLKLLADERWVSSRRQGTAHLYRMTREAIDPHSRKLWTLAREQLEGWPTLAQDEIRLSQVLANRQPEEQDAFASKADNWDRIRDEFYGQSYLLEAALGLLPPSSIVADLGCGTGALSIRIAPHVAKVIAVDSSAAMLKTAKRKAEAFNNIEFLRADLAELPIEDASVDAAIMLLVLSYNPDPKPAVGELSRILKPNGKAVLVDLLAHDRKDFTQKMGQHHQGFTLKTLQSLMQTVGLENTTTHPIPPTPKGLALAFASGVKRKV